MLSDAQIRYSLFELQISHQKFRVSSKGPKFRLVLEWLQFVITHFNDFSLSSDRPSLLIFRYKRALENVSQNHWNEKFVIGSCIIIIDFVMEKLNGIRAWDEAENRKLHLSR